MNSAAVLGGGASASCLGHGVSDESVHILEWDFRSQPFVLLFDRAYNWTCQQQFNMMHLFTNLSPGLINHFADRCDAVLPPLQPYLTIRVCVCAWLYLLRAVDFVYLWPLQPRRSARVIWAGGDHRYWLTFGAAPRWGRCEFLNKHAGGGEGGGGSWHPPTHPPEHPPLTFARLQRVRRPNTVLLPGYY